MINELQVDTATGWLNWLTFGWFGDDEAAEDTDSSYSDPYVGGGEPWWISGAANTTDAEEVAEEVAEEASLDTEWEWEWPTSGMASPAASPWEHSGVESDDIAAESIASTEDADAELAYVFHVEIL